MDLASIPLFSVMKARMEYISERQATLAQNVANADTPNYKAQDVSTPDFMKLAQNAAGSGESSAIQMVATNPKHMLSSQSPNAFKITARDTTAELNPNGNNVAIEDEMRLVAQNQMDYSKTINLYQKMVSLFKTALDNNPGGA